jgi:hypothetical protein
VSRKQQRGRGKPGTPGREQQAGGAQQQPQKSAGGAGWAPLRDGIRRDIEQAMAALAFAERLHTRLDTQRRLYTDFPRVMEQLRSGALERLAGSLSRLYEGGQGFDLQRFLRDLPLATAQLALAEAQARRAATKDAGAAKTEAGAGKAQSPSGDAAAAEMPTAAATPTESAAATESAPATATPTATETATAAPTGSATATESAPTTAAPTATESAPAAPTESAPAPATPPATESAAEESGPVSPRLEMRSKLLLAAPQLAKAAVGYRRNVATVRRAAAPRRSPGPWRSDREVLEEARRAAEFARQIFDAYAEAWADQPLTGDAEEGMAAEADRFLAWTQLNRYVELAVHGDPRHQKELQGRKVQPPPATEAGAAVAAADAAPAEPAPQQPEAPAEAAASGEPAQ